MMNETGPYTQDVFVADFTDYNNNHPKTPAPYAGVLIATEENGIIPSFKLTDKNGYPFMAVNFEENPAVFMREDGRMYVLCHKGSVSGLDAVFGTQVLRSKKCL